MQLDWRRFSLDILSAEKESLCICVDAVKCCLCFAIAFSKNAATGFIFVALIIAAIWAVWHLPLFLIEGRLQYDWNFGLYAILILGLGFLLAAIYRLTKSVWLCVLFHALVNTMFEDTSFIIRLSYFNEDFIPLAITTSVLIIVSCLTVKFVKSIPKRRTD